MVLAYQGMARSQSTIARQLKTEATLGTPARNVQRLSSNKITVVHEAGSLEQIQRWLESNIPVITSVQAEELSYWEGESFQHAVVIVGLQEATIWLLDPELDATPVAVPIDEFMLAWDGMDYLYAAIVVNR